MSQVFMTHANKGLVEFSVIPEPNAYQRRLKVAYQVHTLGDTEAVRREFQQALAEALTSVIAHEDPDQFVLVSVQPDDFGYEMLAG